MHFRENNWQFFGAFFVSGEKSNNSKKALIENYSSGRSSLLRFIVKEEYWLQQQKSRENMLPHGAKEKKNIKGRFFEQRVPEWNGRNYTYVKARQGDQMCL
jgi:hypothetical protein